MKKKTLFLALLLPLLLVGCAPQKPKSTLYPFNPPELVNFRVYNTSVDNVWDAVIDFASEAGFSIDILDKSSGLITMTPYAMSVTYWIPEQGGYVNPKAEIAAQYSTAYKEDGTGLKATARWNIRIRKSKDTDSTVATINITNLKVTIKLITDRIYRGYFIYEPILSDVKFPYETRSTGVFEQLMLDAISRRIEKL